MCAISFFYLYMAREICLKRGNLMRILFLTDYWFPNMTANAICIRNISEELINQNNQVFVSAYYDKNSQNMQGEIIFSFIKPSLARRLLRASQRVDNKTKAWVYSKLGKLMNRIRRALLIPFYPVTSLTVPFRWNKQANAFIKKHDIDTVVSVVAPDESLFAGYLIKKSNPNIKWIVYYIDSGTNILHGTSFEKAKKLLHAKAIRWENRVLMKAEKIIVMEGHYSYYLNTLNDMNRKKLYVANVPLLIKNKDNIHLSYSNKNKVQKWVYTGNISGDFYNPQCMCEFFLAYCKEHDAELHLYGVSDHKGYLTRVQEKCPKIIWHGPVSHEDALKAQAEADVLIYFKCGRLDSVSGKLFEYLSLRKPVVYIGADDDINAQQLEKYRKGLVLNYQDSVLNQVSQVDRFLESDDLKTEVTMEEIEEAYYYSLPSTTVKIISSKIEK